MVESRGPAVRIHLLIDSSYDGIFWKVVREVGSRAKLMEVGQWECVLGDSIGPWFLPYALFSASWLQWGEMLSSATAFLPWWMKSPDTIRQNKPFLSLSYFCQVFCYSPVKLTNTDKQGCHPCFAYVVNNQRVNFSSEGNRHSLTDICALKKNHCFLEQDLLHTFFEV